MEYRYVVKSVIGYKNIGNENFEHVIKVPLISPRDIPRIYKSFLESHKNVNIEKNFKRLDRSKIKSYRERYSKRV